MVHQPWVLQALFYDWLNYNPQNSTSIMLVEPGMLLMYRSAENNPHMTDSLVEYLFNYITYFDQSKQTQFMLSV